MKKEQIKEWNELQQQLQDVVAIPSLIQRLKEWVFGNGKVKRKCDQNSHHITYGNTYRETWVKNDPQGIAIANSDYVRIFQDGTCKNCGLVKKREIKPGE